MFPAFFSFLGGPCAVDEDVQLPYPLVLPNQRTGISRFSLLISRSTLACHLPPSLSLSYAFLSPLIL